MTFGKMKYTFAILSLFLLTACALPSFQKKSRNQPPSVALEEKWKGHEEYISGIINAVDKRWEWIVKRSRSYPAPGTTVVVKFRLEAHTGDIPEIISVDSSGTKEAIDMCVSAIVSQAPYGKWTPEMKNEIGDSTDVTFTFHYQ
jgi:hypothetical protein